MKKIISFLSVLFFLTGSIYSQNVANPSKDNLPVKITFIGASITYGSGVENREQNAYPAQLQQLLGEKYKVNNYGVSSCTMLRKGDHPYWNTPQYQLALASLPDIVFIDLGGNDAKLINRVHSNELVKDCRDMIQSFARLASHPRIILLLPVVSFVPDSAGIWDPAIVQKIIPPLRQAALEEGVELIDIHSLLVNHPELLPDKIHPNKQGATIIANRLHALLVQKRDMAFNIFSKITQPLKMGSFYGYPVADFTFKDRQCKIVQPKWSAQGHPWVWRARFWGHEPQTDIALLEHGFHIVYCDVAELLGNKECIGIWDNFYALVHKAGLSKKAVMEGMSRGAVYVFNWAAANPKKVAGVYVDNPLLNINAWALPMLQLPEGKKDDMFEALKKDYNLKTAEDVRQFNEGPLESVKKIVKGKYPILILCADEDEAVPPAEQTLLFEKKVKELNGDITVIHKPGFKHHPHSLPNPTPIVDFILNATGLGDLVVPE